MTNAVKSWPFRMPLPVALVTVVVTALLAVTLVAPGAVLGAASYDLEATYRVNVRLGWDTRWVTVRTTIDLRNTSGGAVDRLLLNTSAAKLGGLRNLRVRVDGEATPAVVVSQTIRVELDTPLAQGASASVFVGYRARLRTSAKGRGYYFAKLGGVVQMYRFIPWISRKIPFSSQDHGEPFLTPTSPRVEVTVTADRKLVWATSGRRTGSSGPRTFTFVANNVRDFNLAASPGYKTYRGTSKDGGTKIFAHVRGADGPRLVRLARDELARYRSLTGVPYPHSTYRIVETGGGLPMESPALTWIPASRPAVDHPYLVSHETAHQWWYSTVGNDQSTDAFADEAMADYFSRKAHLSIRPSRCRTDRLDREIRSYSTYCYYEVVYVQGARFLDNLRRDYGNARFMAAIRAYTRDHRFEIGSNARLLEAFRAQMGDTVLKRFHYRFPSIY